MKERILQELEMETRDDDGSVDERFRAVGRKSKSHQTLIVFLNLKIQSCHN